MRTTSLISSADPRDVPSYTLGEASHYLDMPKSTLRSWCLGQKSSSGSFRAILTLPNRHEPVLSFTNLVEAHVLDGLRREHDIPMQRLRRALQYIAKLDLGPHPLASSRFRTDGLSVFVEHYGKLINASQEGQLAIQAVLERYLRRIEWDKAGGAERLFPFTRRREVADPRAVVIDPRVAFGRPVLVGTGIPTAVIVSRLKAGETIQELAKDYDRAAIEIEEAIRCELRAA